MGICCVFRVTGVEMWGTRRFVCRTEGVGFEFCEIHPPLVVRTEDEVEF
jgi:hypothetical protein